VDARSLISSPDVLAPRLGKAGPQGYAAAVWRSLHPWYAIAALFWMAVIVTLSSIPRAPAVLRRPFVEQGFNLSHFFFYAILAALVGLALSGRAPWSGIRRAGLVTFIVVAVFAVTDEWHQSMVRGRSASLGDLAVDLLGLCAVLLLGAVVRARGERV